MACGNTFNPRDASIAAKSIKPLGHPALPANVTLTTTSSTESLIVGGLDNGIPVAAAFSLGVDSLSIAMFNERIPQFSPEAKSDLVQLARRQPSLEAQLIEGLGNPALDGDMATALPTALHTIITYHEPSPGLFTKLGPERGPYQTPWVSDLANRGNGVANGIAYEVLMTSRMHTKAVGTLRISTGDHLAFGQKAQGRYGDWGGPKRSSEADLLIRRGTEEISIDFKYRSSGKASLYAKDIETVKIALLSGEWTEMHYISNKTFDSTSKNLIEKLNEELTRAGVMPVILHERQNWR